MRVANEPAPVILFLPARNEAATVVQVIEATPPAIEYAGVAHPVRVLVVDDGSTDGTGDLALAAGAEVVRTVGLGLGAAVRIGLGLAVASGAVAVAFCDADREYDPSQLADLVTPVLADEADYVVGSRFLGGPRRMRLHRMLGNRLLTAVVRALTSAHRARPLTDGQSGFRALSASAAARAEIVHDYNYAQVLTVDVLAKGYRYVEVPISYAHREVGRSFVRLPTYLRHVVPALWHLQRAHRRSPMTASSVRTA